MRHPIYTGIIVALLGSALAAGSVDAFIGVALAAASLVIKLRREEALLSGEFGEQYAEFKRDVPALVPFVY